MSGGGVEIAAGKQRFELLLADSGMNELAEFWRSELEQMAGMPQGILERSQAAPGDTLDARQPQLSGERLDLFPFCLSNQGLAPYIAWEIGNTN